jgi:hypothetical protein
MTYLLSSLDRVLPRRAEYSLVSPDSAPIFLAAAGRLYASGTSEFGAKPFRQHALEGRVWQIYNPIEYASVACNFGSADIAGSGNRAWSDKFSPSSHLLSFVALARDQLTGITLPHPISGGSKAIQPKIQEFCWIRTAIIFPYSTTKIIGNPEC